MSNQTSNSDLGKNRNFKEHKTQDGVYKGKKITKLTASGLEKNLPVKVAFVTLIQSFGSMLEELRDMY